MNKESDQPVGGRCDTTICCHNHDGFCYCAGDCLNCLDDDVPIIRRINDDQ